MNVFNKSSKLAVGFTLIRTLANAKNLDKVQPSKQKGFTLIELLVVMAILGILAVVGISSFRTSLAKSRDAKRKSDLEQVQRALEMYFNDKGTYPPSGDLVFDGSVFKDVNETIYMKELPKDPTGKTGYCYIKVASPISYKLYAKLENSQDSRCLGGQSKCADPQGTCGGSKVFNYGVSSSNTVP